MEIKQICIVGPMPPPVHGASVLARLLSLHLGAVEIRSNITHQNSERFSMFRKICMLFRSLLTVNSGKFVVFTASELPGKFRDLVIILILIIRKRDLYVCVHNNPFYSDDLLGSIHKYLAKFYTIIYSYRSPEFEDCLNSGFRVKVIKNAVPEESDISCFMKRRQLAKNGFDGPIKFLICANPHPFKNIQFTIDALRKLKTDWTLDVIGALDSQFARDLVANNQSANIKFLGAVHGTSKFKMLADSDILLHLSTNEEFPLIQLEALLMETPFISLLGVGGLYHDLPESIKKKYFFSSGTIANGGLDAIVNSLRCDMAVVKEAKDFYLKNHGLEKMINEYSELLRNNVTDNLSL